MGQLMRPRRITDGFQKPRIQGLPVSVIEMLRKDYAPRCKHVGEAEEVHQRYAGQVELAAKILKMVERGDDDSLTVETA